MSQTESGSRPADAPAEGLPLVLATRDDAIGILTLNDPARRNVLSMAMLTQLLECLKEAAGDLNLKCLVIAANGPAFSAGHDLREIVASTPDELERLFELCTRVMEAIRLAPQPVIAQVQGIATAAGCQLVAWCDMAVAETGARFGTPGVKIGLFCTTPMVAVTRAIGRKAAMEMLMTGRLFPAQEAKELGLINRVVPPEDLASETLKMAKQIAEASRFVIAIGKKAFYAQADQPEEKAMEYATRTITMNMMAEDAEIGIKAFLEKKTPEWKNR